ncbi:hypothetical protein C1646_703451 [Rhizophagus diaphanus]|nr:hypothetical protein C1646_703451 [Rhizophagus diaphanus] [Rhizophagus sp. MUCL 43196]
MCQNFVLAEDEIFDETNLDIVGNEEEIVAIVPMGPILSSELEGLKHPLITSSIELSIGTRFSSWEVAEYYLKVYGRQKDFVIKKYRVEYHKNSSSNSCERPVKKRTLTCEYSGNTSLIRIIWKHKSLTYHQPFIVKRFFSNIERKFKNIFHPELLMNFIIKCVNQFFTDVKKYLLKMLLNLKKINWYEKFSNFFCIALVIVSVLVGWIS